MKATTAKRIKAAEAEYLADGERHPRNLLIDAGRMLMDCAVSSSDEEAETLAVKVIVRLIAYVEAGS